MISEEVAQPKNHVPTSLQGIMELQALLPGHPGQKRVNTALPAGLLLVGKQRMLPFSRQHQGGFQ
jgi:hypothetical protein